MFEGHEALGDCQRYDLLGVTSGSLALTYLLTYLLTYSLHGAESFLTS